MKNLSIKNQHKVMKTISSMCYACPNCILYKPVGFDKYFPYLQKKDLFIILDILEGKGLIEVCYGDYPDSLNIWSIFVTDAGFSYLPQASFDNRERWKERIWGFLSGSFFTALVSVSLQWLL